MYHFTTSGGAGESGLARLVHLQFLTAAGDATVAVSLAGTLFFTLPTDQARPQVAQFLLLTMAPFAIVAPFIGPFLDRFRHGRRWAIGVTLALRGFLCWVLADVLDNSLLLFPAALGCLVASKAFTVTQASAVPRLLPDGFTLVNANSRISMAKVGGAAIGGWHRGRDLPGRPGMVAAIRLRGVHHGHRVGHPAPGQGRLLLGGTRHRRPARLAHRSERRAQPRIGSSGGSGASSRACCTGCAA